MVMACAAAAAAAVGTTRGVTPRLPSARGEHSGVLLYRGAAVTRRPGRQSACYARLRLWQLLSSSYRRPRLWRLLGSSYRRPRLQLLSSSSSSSRQSWQQLLSSSNHQLWQQLLSSSSHHRAWQRRSSRHRRPHL